MIFHSIVIQAVSMFYHVFLRFLVVKSFIFNLPSAPAERHYFISISFCYFYVCNKNKRSYNFAFYCYLSFNNINSPFIVPNFTYPLTVFVFIPLNFFENIELLCNTLYAAFFKSNKEFPFIVIAYFKHRLTGI